MTPTAGPFDLLNSDGTGPARALRPGQRKLRARSAPGPVRLHGGEQNADIKDFTLHLPPGFLGNPTAPVACPQPPVGRASRARPRPASATPGPPSSRPVAPGQPRTAAPDTGLQRRDAGARARAARHRALPLRPGRPVPVAISVRTAGDRGLDSTAEQHPAQPRRLHRPCRSRSTPSSAAASLPADSSAPSDAATNWVTYSLGSAAQTRPFFVNPTSCGTKTVRRRSALVADERDDLHESPPT